MHIQWHKYVIRQLRRWWLGLPEKLFAGLLSYGVDGIHYFALVLRHA